MEQGMPVFVKVDEYKEVLELVNNVKEQLHEAKARLEQINELRNEEDTELEAWRLNVEDVEKKVEFIDNTLFEPEGY